MRKPEFITFTGADDHTDVRDMVALSKLYPIEWGILFSISRQGTDPRYPGGEAARLCGSGLCARDRQAQPRSPWGCVPRSGNGLTYSARVP